MKAMRLFNILSAQHNIGYFRSSITSATVMSKTLIIAGTCLVGFQSNAYAAQFECLLEPHVVVNISSSVAGILDEVSVERGDQVSKGQIIARLKSGVEQAAVDLAREKAEFSKRKVDRNAELIEKKLLSPHETDELVTDKQMADMELHQAEEVLDQRTIKSPIYGVVVERFLSSGEFVQSEPILKLAQLHPLNVEVIMPVEQVNRIKNGMTAEVLLDGPIKGKYNAKVVVVDRVIDAASSTIGVRLELPNPDYAIPAGLKCQVRFK